MAWDVVVDSCSVRSKHSGELTGPNPTDRGKRGTKYHVVVASDGTPFSALLSAAIVHDTMLFPALLHRALADLTVIRLTSARQTRAGADRPNARDGNKGHPAANARRGWGDRRGLLTLITVSGDESWKGR